MTFTDLSGFANHLWQSTLCAAVVWLLMLALKRHRTAACDWLWLAAVGLGAVVGSVVLCAVAAAAQSPNSNGQVPDQWIFEVASVKQHKPDDDSASMNVPISPGDASSHAGDLFRGINIPLVAYIYFAYELTGSQLQLLMPQLSKLPGWVSADRFDIQARAEGNPTKEQMRLMMKSLLEDRFKLAIHYEAQQRPVFALVLAKPGKTGPNLRLHSDASSCSPAASAIKPNGVQSASVPGGFPIVCGGVVGMAARVPGLLRAGARNVSIGLLASTLAQMGDLDRPVVDRTGLSGTFDFVFEWAPQRDSLAAPGLNAQVDDPGQTFVEDLKEQLGLKLESQKGVVEVLVIDHIEKPSEN
jgi:uncharacterized protein (TIGR03435 family)